MARFPVHMLAGGIAAITVTQGVAAQQAQVHQFDLAPQPLKYALRAVTRIEGLQLFAMSDDVEGKQSPALHGAYSAQQALDLLLADSGLRADISGQRVFIRGRLEGPADQAGLSDREIVVTGSRISGAPIASPLIRRTQQDIIDAGQTNLGDAVRSIPQNFGGSQNPGAGLNVPQGNGLAVGSGSSIDLRGLGGDATLTLLNGHRLSYDAALQAIDVSTIPLVALDRIEIVADGSSALYGSDAVAGVANIILKPDYSGLRTSARLGASTDGGNEQQQYDVVGGTTWDGGGVLASYTFARSTRILARERSYAATVSPGLTLLPMIRQQSAVVTGHQAIGPFIEFSLDALYSDRSTAMRYGVSAALDPALYNIARYYHSRSASVAPSIKFRLSDSWSAKVEGTYGDDRDYYRVTSHSNGAFSLDQAGCYCNQVWDGEASVNGRLFSLPGGPARLAFGGGYRSTGYHGYDTRGGSRNIDIRQSTYFAFGELNLPIIKHLNVNVAGRYEDYPGVANVATPKLGLVYALSPAFDIKGSWGRSFKAPTFYERYSAQSANLYSPALLGGSGYPSNATVLAVLGGNPDLKPERATTWSASIAFHPLSVKSLHAEISYFHVNYVERIVAPITYLTQALSDPRYAQYIVSKPSPAELAEALAGRIFSNYSGHSYDPANVIALVEAANVNAETQTARGVDISLDYKLGLASGQAIRFSIDGAYIHSDQRISTDQPVTALAGTIFNPAHYRGRAGAVWTAGDLTLSSFLNYTGGVRDVRLGQTGNIRSMTTFDVAATYHVPGAKGVFKGIDVALSALNLFNAKPQQIAIAGIYETPYDSLNYSPVGRFVSLTIGKSW